jgi:hypothetical protein
MEHPYESDIEMEIRVRLHTRHCRATRRTFMKFKRCKIPVHLRFIAAGTCLGLFAGCATTPQQISGPQYAPAANVVRQARSSQVPVETRAADYLQAAAMTAPMLGKGTEPTPASDTYNVAAAELTILLRSADGGRLWNHPLTVTNGSATYHLRLQPASYAVWSPDYFTSFKLPSSMKNEGRVKTFTEVEGVGGALVGVRHLTPPEDFAPKRGISAPVTATLDFHGRDATLALRRPARQPTARVEGASAAGSELFRATTLSQAHQRNLDRTTGRVRNKSFFRP